MYENRCSVLKKEHLGPHNINLKSKEKNVSIFAVFLSALEDSFLTFLREPGDEL